MLEDMKSIKQIIFMALVIVTSACNDYIDVVPDNVATLDNAFALRNEAEKYLFTCYSYLPLIPQHYNLTLFISS